jgi:nicotinate-nucleotide adenylyltransferase
MAEIATRELVTTGKVKVISDELDRGGLSFTVETLGRLKAQNKSIELFLCMGADQLAGFNKWRDYKKILSLANLVVTTRPGHELPKTKTELPTWLQTELSTFRFPKSVLKSKKTIQFVVLQDVEVSASEIRRRARRNEQVEHLTPHAVADYIRENKVYTAADLKIADYQEFAKFCSHVMNDRGALSIQGYDLRKLTQPAEFSIVASGTSTRHVRALCENVVKEAKEQFDIYPVSTEGMQEGRWVIIDYGSLMIHFFYDFVRNEYRIEDLWKSAPRIQV